jgi:hypothetical protein
MTTGLCAAPVTASLSVALFGGEGEGENEREAQEEREA